MTGAQRIGPTAIHLKDGQLHIDGYPEAVCALRLDSRLARRLERLRLHQSALIFCDKTMSQFLAVRETNPLAAEAMLVACIVKFFSCFGKNNSSGPLSAQRVFKGNEAAFRCFEYWKALRDKHIAHDESKMTTLLTGLVVGPQGSVIDIISLKAVPDLGSEADGCRSLWELASYALRHVEAEVEALLPELFREARALSEKELSKLSPLAFSVPTSQDVDTSRP